MLLKAHTLHHSSTHFCHYVAVVETSLCSSYLWLWSSSEGQNSCSSDGRNVTRNDQVRTTITDWQLLTAVFLQLLPYFILTCICLSCIASCFICLWSLSLCACVTIKVASSIMLAVLRRCIVVVRYQRYGRWEWRSVRCLLPANGRDSGEATTGHWSWSWLWRWWRVSFLRLFLATISLFD